MTKINLQNLGTGITTKLDEIEVDASKTNKGRVQIGDGLDVSNGLVSLSAPQNPSKFDVVYPGESRPLKVWAGIGVIAGGAGLWLVDFTEAGFTQVRSIQLTLESPTTIDNNRPLSAYIISKSLTGVSGKAYKAFSTGLLTAMQQHVAENGVQVHVLVIGH